MRPTPFFVWGAGGVLLLETCALFFPLFRGWDLIVLIVLGLAAVWDGIGLLFLKPPTIVRKLPGSILLGRNFPVTVVFTDLPIRARLVEIFDGIPSSVTAPALPLKIVPQKNERRENVPQHYKELQYSAVCDLRGDATFVRASGLITSPLGLWKRSFRGADSQTVRVYSALPAEDRTALESAAQISIVGGERLERRRGQGLEFHQLRDYQEGDPLRSVDWKSTSRFRKLVVREYQEEQNQELVFLLDTGYRMHARDGETSHFDRALESLLVVARAALKQGDAVGVMTFGPSARWIPPLKGKHSLAVLQRCLYDVESSAAPSSPSAALEELLGRLKRRCLIVLMTNLREEDGEGLEPHLPLLLRRHLLLTLWLRESVTDEILAGPFERFEDALTAAAARKYLDDREKIHTLWKARGIHLIDTTPDKLSVGLLNSYWNIKKRGLL